MTDSDKLDKIIEMLGEIRAYRKRQPKALNGDNELSPRIEYFISQNRGNFTASDIAEELHLPLESKTYLAIGRIMDTLNIERTRTNKARYFILK